MKGHVFVLSFIMINKQMYIDDHTKTNVLRVLWMIGILAL